MLNSTLVVFICTLNPSKIILRHFQLELWTAQFLSKELSQRMSNFWMVWLAGILQQNPNCISAFGTPLLYTDRGCPTGD